MDQEHGRDQGFLTALGISPALGREFEAREEVAGSVPAIMISQRLWREAFQRDPGVLGRSIKLDTTTYTVVGILPENYWFPQMADALVVLQSRSGGVEDNGTNTSVIARLRDGVSLRQAQAETANLTQSFRQAFAERISSNYKDLVLVNYQDWLVGNVRMNLLLLFGTTGFLFLMVCSNLASLLLARLASREKEIALRFRRISPQAPWRKSFSGKLKWAPPLASGKAGFCFDVCRPGRILYLGFRKSRDSRFRGASALNLQKLAESLSWPLPAKPLPAETIKNILSFVRSSYPADISVALASIIPNSILPFYIF
jgi:hypothetical protein